MKYTREHVVNGFCFTYNSVVYEVTETPSSRRKLVNTIAKDRGLAQRVNIEGLITGLTDGTYKPHNQSITYEIY